MPEKVFWVESFPMDSTSPFLTTQTVYSRPGGGFDATVTTRPENFVSVESVPIDLL